MWGELEWDENKARGNLRKYGVSFEEARSVFFDALAAVFDLRPEYRLDYSKATTK